MYDVHLHNIMIHLCMLFDASGTTDIVEIYK